ncbi:PTS mannose/fructose/sorbose transporter subunit IIC [Dolosicoccus paucivorans]|uniref:PTS mannose/fructose/sorbose transporter subunit IIC n=1 Tax=Dolosicoccus paucivorans TaxID=84521 RepID=A0A1G8NAA3_9LACT|nr:PTS mannose/fructose/sorbose transporter subunit IIC [Dolosicoccus paucivorans]PMB84875.1 PTS mannose/fructose/sorbose transporter subunit IIC [Dolosicoccus paucivorans]PMC58871.1 PTS mannose/fructose/sorbose transporter subunit IIC [Dolosicoccus paucivorans]SDI77201.1 PTS system, mannose-specific IIC component [Dolosicoccus paucivorans]
MDINMIQALFILIVALFAGFESVLDEFQLHQPIITCTLIGLITGDLATGLFIGGSLQLIALGWMNVGAAQAPDIAIAGVIAGILTLAKGAGTSEAIAIAIPLAIAGQVLTIFVRTLAVGLGHYADRQAESGNIRGVELANLAGLMLQGLRVAIPAGLVLAIPTHVVVNALAAIPAWITGGLAVGGGMVVAVGYAMVINMMASKLTWPFFFIGFGLSALTELNLVAMGIIGASLALIYIQLDPRLNSEFASAGGGGSVESALTDILEDY